MTCVVPSLAYEKEFSMPRRHPSTQPVYAIRQYLERAFPGQVRVLTT
jgi:hypothetical protein